MSTRLAEPRATELGDPGPAVSDLGLDRDAMWSCYREVRRTTEALCAPLEVEDYVIQSMPDASPAKWHLAHTSWFFETFILAPRIPGLAARRSSISLPVQFLLQCRGRADRTRSPRPALAADGGRGLAVSRGDRPANGRLPRTGRRARGSPGSGIRSSSGCITSSSTRSSSSPTSSTPSPAIRSVPPIASTARRGTNRPGPVRGMVFVSRGRPLDRPCGGYLRVRQRDAAAQPVRRCLRARRPARHESRVPRVHRRRGLRPARALAVGWLVRVPPERLDGAPLLGAVRRGVASLHPRRDARPGPRRAGLPRQLTTRPTPSPAGRAPGSPPRPSGKPRPSPQAAAIEGNFLESGRFHPAPLSSGSDSAPYATPVTALRRRLGMDAEPVHALPGIPPGRRRARRVQWQVHVQPDGAPRRLVRHAQVPHPGRPTGTSSRPSRAGSSRASAWPATCDQPDLSD